VSLSLPIFWTLFFLLLHEEKANTAKNNLLSPELCFRHLYSKREEPSLELRFGSWNNYCQLFDSICSNTRPLLFVVLFWPLISPIPLHAHEETSGELELPLQWLWDMIDEFIFQFQLNHAKLALFQDNPDVWSVTSVRYFLLPLLWKGGEGRQKGSSEDVWLLITGHHQLGEACG